MVNYLMVQGNLTRILRWRGEEELLCFRCGERINVGDRIHRNNGGIRDLSHEGRGSQKRKARFYHEGCYEGMFC